MENEEREYQLDQCATCVHAEVCKYIDIYDELVNHLPVDLSSALCDEYIYADISGVSEEGYDDRLCEDCDSQDCTGCPCNECDEDCDECDSLGAVADGANDVDNSNVYGYSISVPEGAILTTPLLSNLYQALQVLKPTGFTPRGLAMNSATMRAFIIEQWHIYVEVGTLSSVCIDGYTLPVQEDPSIPTNQFEITGVAGGSIK